MNHTHLCTSFRMENSLACGFPSILCLILLAVLLPCVLGEAASDLTWTRPAAEAAEAAASHTCSCHGFIFTDTLPGPNDSYPVCECVDCFDSETCADKEDNCSVNVQVGDPQFMQPFWLLNRKPSTNVVPSWYRMSYKLNDHATDILNPTLKYWIIRLHDLVGNAVTKNKYIVPGAGSLHLINAAVHSLSYSPHDHYLQNRTLVVAAAPYYPSFRTQTQLFDSIRYKWAGDSKKYVNHTIGRKFVEIITNPTNPEGYREKGILHGDVKILSDRVCYWPHYTPINETADDDVMLFSLSKLTGHAGTRFGWALVKDKAVYERMKNYVEKNINTVSHDAQFRAIPLLRTIVEGYEKNIDCQKMFDIGHHELRCRWTKIADLFNKTKRFSLQNTSPGYCNFFKKVMQPAEGYAWVTCNQDADCTQVFANAGIQAQNGTNFEGNLNQTRISLVKRRDNFDLLYEKLKKLINPTSAYAKIIHGGSTRYVKAV